MVDDEGNDGLVRDGSWSGGWEEAPPGRALSSAYELGSNQTIETGTRPNEKRMKETGVRNEMDTV